MTSKVMRYLKGKVSKMKGVDGCWNCINVFESPKEYCNDCEDYSEWSEIDDYSADEVWNWDDDYDNWEDSGEDW